MMVAEFHGIIGEETLTACENKGIHPTHLVACLGGGSNALGLFLPFLEEEVRLIGVEAAGEGVDSGRTAATIERGSPGILHGAKTMILQDEEGQIEEAHSISAGLDYPGIGPLHAHLASTGRLRTAAATDEEAVQAGLLCTRLEGILPALETAHALAWTLRADWTERRGHPQPQRKGRQRPEELHPNSRRTMKDLHSILREDDGVTLHFSDRGIPGHENGRSGPHGGSGGPPGRFLR